MLVLSRCPRERIFLHLEDGREIILTVVDIHRGRHVRIGIDAPKTIVIRREELAMPHEEGTADA
jgi:carbon storage regulator CsrA